MQTPRTHVLARAVIRTDGRVLVVRAEGQPHTFLPGGHREEGETLSACLRRELHEELGVTAVVDEYLGAVEHRWMREGTPQYELNHCFATRIPALSLGEPPDAREPYLTFHWASVERLEEVRIEPKPLRRLLAEDGASAQPWWASTLDGPGSGVDSEPSQVAS